MAQQPSGHKDSAGLAGNKEYRVVTPVDTKRDPDPGQCSNAVQAEPCSPYGQASDKQSNEEDEQWSNSDDDENSDEESYEHLSMYSGTPRYPLHQRIQDHKAALESLSLLSSGSQALGTGDRWQLRGECNEHGGSSKAPACSKRTEEDRMGSTRSNKTLDGRPDLTSQQHVEGNHSQHQQHQADATTAAHASTDTVLEPSNAAGDLRGLRQSIAERRANSLVGWRPHIHITAPPASKFIHHPHHAPSFDSHFDNPFDKLACAEKETGKIKTSGQRSQPAYLQTRGVACWEELRLHRSPKPITTLTGCPPSSFAKRLAYRGYPHSQTEDSPSEGTERSTTTPLFSPLPGPGSGRLKHDSNDSLLFPIDPFERAHYNNTPSPKSLKNASSPTHSPLNEASNTSRENLQRPQSDSSDLLFIPSSSGMATEKHAAGANTTSRASSSRAMNSTSSSASHMADLRRPSPNLQLPAFPRFHPAVYQAPSATTSPTRLRQREQRVRGPLQSHSRQGSDAQQQLYQYQREMIASAARATPHGFNQPSRDTPKAPMLVPCGSPGPTTPLMLEEQADYLTAGVVGVVVDGSPRELVDTLIRNERDRRSGLSSGNSSPAISPAGGRG